MNKLDLINEVAAESGATKTQVESMINDITYVIMRTMRMGESVKIVGFGTFYPLEKKPRAGRNPQTGKKIKIPKNTVARFRAGQDFKKLLNV